MFWILIAFVTTCCIAVIYVYKSFRSALINDLTGRHVLITGTDSGFGRKLALDLARQGFIVHAGCFTESGSESLRKEAETSANNLKTLILDVTNDESVTAAKKTVESNLPPDQGLWALVNNAGIVRGVIFEFASFEDYEKTMDVNFYGILRVTSAFLPLVQKARGRVVNLISILGRLSLAAGPYSCSKFAAEAYSDGLRRLMAPLGVKVSIIEPGFYPTFITSGKNFCADIDRSWAALSEDVRNLYGESYLANAKGMIEKQAESFPLASGNRIEDVTESIEHAICAVHPKTRYVCGMDAHILYRPAAAITPDWLLDFSIEFMKEVSRRRVTSAHKSEQKWS